MVLSCSEFVRVGEDEVAMSDKNLTGKKNSKKVAEPVKKKDME